MTALAAGATGYWLRFDAPVRDVLRDRSGGAVYVLVWILAFAAAMPRVSVVRLTGSVLLATCGLEFLQLWHPPWLEEMRRTFAGRVILGTTFDWLDLPPYALGAALGGCIVKAVSRS